MLKDQNVKTFIFDQNYGKKRKKSVHGRVHENPLGHSKHTLVGNLATPGLSLGCNCFLFVFDETNA